MIAIARTSVHQQMVTFPLLPENFILPDDPVENTDQPLLAAALRQPLTAFPDLIQDALIVSNFALCATIEERIICKAPDWMYVKPVQPWKSLPPRRSYTPHTQGSVPQVVMEFLSATYGEEYSMESTVGVGKWFFYEQVIQVPNYTIFRPEIGRVEVYALENGRYRLRTPDEAERYWIPGIDLFLGVWQGTHEGRTGYWLRWWNGNGELLLWTEERLDVERQEKQLAQQRIQALEERLRILGVKTDELNNS